MFLSFLGSLKSRKPKTMFSVGWSQNRVCCDRCSEALSLSSHVSNTSGFSFHQTDSLKSYVYLRYVWILYFQDRERDDWCFWALQNRKTKIYVLLSVLASKYILLLHMFWGSFSILACISNISVFSTCSRCFCLFWPLQNWTPIDPCSVVCVGLKYKIKTMMFWSSFLSYKYLKYP